MASLSEDRHGERRTRARRVVCFSSQRPYPSALFEALMTFPDLSALSQRGVGGKGTRPEDAPTSPRRRTRALAQNAEEGWGACATADMFPAVLHSNMSAVPGVQYISRLVNVAPEFNDAKSAGRMRDGAKGARISH